MRSFSWKASKTPYQRRSAVEICKQRGLNGEASRYFCTGGRTMRSFSWKASKTPYQRGSAVEICKQRGLYGGGK